MAPQSDPPAPDEVRPTGAGRGGPGTRRSLLPFLPLPAVFLAVVLLFGGVVGPYHLAPNYDPDYVYLLNGLNLAILQSPEHIDHPGTPLQLLLALGIRMATVGSSPVETAVGVLAHAEAYLATANLVFVLVYAAVMVWAGAAVASRLGRRAAGWLVQATPFLLGGNFPQLLRVSPEPVLLLISLALAPLLVGWDGAERRGAGWRRRWLPCFLVATGICVKITFLPVLAIWLMLERGWKDRAWSVAWVAVFGLAWTIPIWGKYERVVGWFWGLAAKEGPYGLGPAGLVSAGSLGEGAIELLSQNALYALCLLAGVGVLLLARSPAAWGRVRGDPAFRLLICLVAGGVLQVLISSKHPQSRYLAPAVGLAGLVWAVMVQVLAAGNRLPAVARARAAGVLAGALVAVGVVVQLGLLYRGTAANARERSALSRATTGQRQGARIFYYGASSPAYALIFGTSYSGQQYFRIIEKLIQSGDCQTYLFNNWTGEFYSLRGPVTFERIAAGGGPILLQGDVLSEAERRHLPPGVTLRERAKAGDETLYELLPVGTAASRSLE